MSGTALSQPEGRGPYLLGSQLLFCLKIQERGFYTKERGEKMEKVDTSGWTDLLGRKKETSTKGKSPLQGGGKKSIGGEEKSLKE